jgi:hypothetical protein
MDNNSFSRLLRKAHRLGSLAAQHESTEFLPGLLARYPHLLSFMRRRRRAGRPTRCSLRKVKLFKTPTRAAFDNCAAAEVRGVQCLVKLSHREMSQPIRPTNSIAHSRLISLPMRDMSRCETSTGRSCVRRSGLKGLITHGLWSTLVRRHTACGSSQGSRRPADPFPAPAGTFQRAVPLGVPRPPRHGVADVSARLASPVKV